MIDVLKNMLMIYRVYIIKFINVRKAFLTANRY